MQRASTPAPRATAPEAWRRRSSRPLATRNTQSPRPCRRPLANQKAWWWLRRRADAWPVAGCSTASSGLAGAHVTLPRVVSCSGVLPSSSAVWWRHGCPDAASLYTDGCSSIQCSDRTLPFTRQPWLHHTLVIVLTLGFHSQSITPPGPCPSPRRSRQECARPTLMKPPPDAPRHTVVVSGSSCALLTSHGWAATGACPSITCALY